MGDLEIRPRPLSSRAKVMAAVIVSEIILMWLLNYYAYLTLPEVVPTHFGTSSEPSGYGDKSVFLWLPAALSVAPFLILLVVKYRFTLINRLPFLINLPAFYMMLRELPEDEMGRFLNKYFELMLFLGVIIGGELLLINYLIYLGALEGRLHPAFLPIVLGSTLAITVLFVVMLARLWGEVKAVKQRWA